MKTPTISARKLLKILLKKGYIIKNQRGSHIHLQHPSRQPLTLPNHDALAIGTLKAIMKAAELTNEDLNE